MANSSDKDDEVMIDVDGSCSLHCSPVSSPSAADEDDFDKNGKEKTVQAADTPKMTERGRRFLIDCLLNLPKDNQTASHHSISNGFHPSSVEGRDSHVVQSQGLPTADSSLPSAASSDQQQFSWNGLSRPAEIRKPVFVNNTWPLWIYYTRYTHRPQIAAQQQAASTSHPHSTPQTKKARSSRHSATHQRQDDDVDGGVATASMTPHRRPKGTASPKLLSMASSSSSSRRVRLAFTAEQLRRLKEEFECNHYLNEPRRKAIADELHLKEAQVKVWFQNKRAQLRRVCNASSFFYLQSPPESANTSNCNKKHISRN